MPIFDYKCIECDRIYKDILVLKKNTDRMCKCGGKLKKILGAPAIHLKGKGFYGTDYKNTEQERKKGEASEQAIPIKKSQ